MLVPLVIGKEQKIKIVSNLQHLCLRVLFLFPPGSDVNGGEISQQVVGRIIVAGNSDGG